MMNSAKYLAYVGCSIYLTKDEDEKETAKLKMPGIIEAVVFVHVVTTHEVYLSI